MSLSVEKLSAANGAFTIAVDSLAVAPGKIRAVMGKSGSGKTTLLHALAGFLPCRSGTISAGGVRVEKLPPEKRRMALVFQQGALFPHLSDFGNIEFPLRFQKVEAAERRRRVEEWLGRLGIADLAARLPHEISGGQAQRVALGRALITGFPVLLLDEPFSAVDSATRAQLRTVLRRLVTESNVAALLVTHDPEDARAVADGVVTLEAGRVSSC
jgi:ABC-type Fe3+/spermidine/putrescine transport system ATPase subunit